MSLIKKLKKQKKVKLGDVANKITIIDQLKQKGLLRTTDYGIFYTYPEVVRTDAAIKNLYLYARLTKLIQPGASLTIHHIDTNEFIAKYTE